MAPEDSGDPLQRVVRVAAISFASRFNRPGENAARMADFAAQAAGAGADWAVFPEVALQGFHGDRELMRDTAEPTDGPLMGALLAAARQHQITLSVGMALRVGERVHNAQVHLGPDGVLGYAAKVHMAGEEAATFDAGHDWPVVDLGFCRVGTLICFDAEFPEAARSLALDGAEVLLMSFATGRCDSCGRPQDPLVWPDQVLTWAPSRAYDNRTFVVATNHAGDIRDEDGVAGSSWIEPGAVHRWPGYAFALDPGGALLAESGREDNREHMLLAELDCERMGFWRQGSGNFLAERRPETYTRLARPW